MRFKNFLTLKEFSDFRNVPGTYITPSRCRQLKLTFCPFESNDYLLKSKSRISRTMTVSGLEKLLVFALITITITT